MLFLSIGEICYIESIEIIEGGNSHSRLDLVAILDSDMKESIMQSQHEIVGVFNQEKEKTKSIFQGYITWMQISTEGELYRLELRAMSHSVKMDLSYCTRVFQDISMSSHQLIQELVSVYEGVMCQLEIPDEPIGQLLVQYGETDWEFLKRIASRYKEQVYVDSSAQGLLIQVGRARKKTKVEWDLYDYSRKQNLELYLDMKQNYDCNVKKDMYVEYELVSNQWVMLGDFISFHQSAFHITKVRRFWDNGLIRHCYGFIPEGCIFQKHYFNSNLLGSSINGSIMGSSRNLVQVQLEVESGADPAKNYWFPFSSVAASSDGSGMYCMPEVGERVRVYFPESDEKMAYAITNIAGHTPKSASPTDPMGNPNQKQLSAQNKGVKFTEDGVLIEADGKLGSICILKSGTVTLDSNMGISMDAVTQMSLKGKRVLLTAKGGITLKTDSGCNMEITEEKITMSAKEIFEN